MARTTIHLMRHGEVHNPEGVLYGRLPGYHLSALGREMAAQVADVLSASGHDVVGVVTSPLERAVETGAPTAAAFGLEASADDRLTEAGNRFEGVPVNRNRWLLAHPRYWAYYLNPLRPSWGEPYADLVVRVSAAVRDARARFAGHEALLVSHQLPIWATRLWLEGRPLAHDPRRRQCSLASLTSLTFDDATLVGLSYWEPAGDLLRRAEDMVPGTSSAAEKIGRAGPEDIVINVQGDEPALESAMLTELIRPFDDARVQVTTLGTPISAREAASPDRVKIVRAESGRALYFSRAPVPFGRETEPAYLGHIGLYGFYMRVLEKFSALSESPLERLEKLEQLRLLEAGIPIHVALTRHKSLGVDRPEDLPIVSQLMQGEQHT